MYVYTSTRLQSRAMASSLNCSYGMCVKAVEECEMKALISSRHGATRHFLPRCTGCTKMNHECHKTCTT